MYKLPNRIKSFPIRARLADVNLIDAAAKKAGVSRSELMMRAALYVADSIEKHHFAPEFMNVKLAPQPHDEDPFGFHVPPSDPPTIVEKVRANVFADLPMIPEFPEEVGGIRDCRVVVLMSDSERENMLNIAGHNRGAASTWIRRLVGKAVAAEMNRR